MTGRPSVLAPDAFRSAFRNHPAGVAVVTADAGDGPVALTATSVFSVSAEPPVLAFSASDQSSATPTLLRAETVVVHLLDVSDVDLARLCSTSGADRFADPDSWTRLPTGEPVFTSASTWMRARVVGGLRSGTATILTVEALQARLPESVEAPLVYHARTWHGLGPASVLG